MSDAIQSVDDAGDVRPATSAQIPALSRVLARAFDDDPFYDFIIPNDGKRARRLEWMFELLLRRYALELRETYTTSGLDGCAIWKPPGDYTMSPLEQLRAMPGFARVIGWNRIRPGMKLIEHLDALHARLAPGPHVYLYVLGVEPRQQGRGVARRLLEPMLARCDAARHDVYLETAKAKNVQFYERYGFELRGIAEHPGLPSLWGMFRPSRSTP